VQIRRGGGGGGLFYLKRKGEKISGTFVRETACMGGKKGVVDAPRRGKGGGKKKRQSRLKGRKERARQERGLDKLCREVESFRNLWLGKKKKGAGALKTFISFAQRPDRMIETRRGENWRSLFKPIEEKEKKKKKRVRGLISVSIFTQEGECFSNAVGQKTADGKKKKKKLFYTAARGG